MWCRRSSQRHERYGQDSPVWPSVAELLPCKQRARRFNPVAGFHRSMEDLDLGRSFSHGRSLLGKSSRRAPVRTASHSATPRPVPALQEPQVPGAMGKGQRDLDHRVPQRPDDAYGLLCPGIQGRSAPGTAAPDRTRNGLLIGLRRLEKVTQATTSAGSQMAGIRGPWAAREILACRFILQADISRLSAVHCSHGNDCNPGVIGHRLSGRIIC